MTSTALPAGIRLTLPGTAVDHAGDGEQQAADQSLLALVGALAERSVRAALPGVRSGALHPSQALVEVAEALASQLGPLQVRFSLSLLARARVPSGLVFERARLRRPRPIWRPSSLGIPPDAWRGTSRSR